MKINIVQPSYFCGENPDEKIAEFLLNQLEKTQENWLTVLPEYSNAGGVSDVESEIKAMDRAKMMLEKSIAYC